MTQEALQIIDGLMLGDGTLRRQRRDAEFRLGQSKSLVRRIDKNEQNMETSVYEHLKYEQWLSDHVFLPLNIKLRKGCPKIVQYVSKGKPYKSAMLDTYQCPLLGSLYNEWYIGGTVARCGCNEYVHGATKVIPQRLMQSDILPIPTLVHFFIGDGCTCWDSLKRKIAIPAIRLALHDFSKEEVTHIADMLRKLNIDTNNPIKQKVQRGSGLSLHIAQHSVNPFMDIVEPYINEIFGSDSLCYKHMILRRTVRSIKWRGIDFTY